MQNEEHASLSFLDLASVVLGAEKRPMTFDEIWEHAQSSGLAGRLRTKGKTPAATLGALLYTSVKKSDSPFTKVGARPARFFLKELAASIPPPSVGEVATPRTRTRTRSFSERDIHPLLVRFAEDNFSVYCKTIFHERSLKKSEKQNQWLHPDIVGFSLTSGDWDHAVVQLAQSTGSSAARFYSFEMKIALDFTTLREFFFQAVSNSSWAHQGYLVAAEIDEDTEFREELKRLSQSFGIGVIQLDLDEPIDSLILYPAEERSEIDWETVNRISTVNSDFADFIRVVSNSIKINHPALSGFDPAPDGAVLDALVRKLQSGR